MRAVSRFSACAERRLHSLSGRFVLVVVLVLAFENPRADYDEEDENDDDSINENKILVSIGITG